jgi:hypothetical protein
MSNREFFCASERVYQYVFFVFASRSGIQKKGERLLATGAVGHTRGIYNINQETRKLGIMSGRTHLTIEELLNGCQPLFPIYAYPNLFPFIVSLNGEDDRWYIKVAENGVYKMNLLRFGPYDI